MDRLGRLSLPCSKVWARPAWPASRQKPSRASARARRRHGGALLMQERAADGPAGPASGASQPDHQATVPLAPLFAPRDGAERHARRRQTLGARRNWRARTCARRSGISAHRCHVTLSRMIRRTPGPPCDGVGVVESVDRTRSNDNVIDDDLLLPAGAPCGRGWCSAPGTCRTADLVGELCRRAPRGSVGARRSRSRP